MQPVTTLSHDQLLTLANKTWAAALGGETDRLEAAAVRLLEAVAAHLCAEHDAVLHLSPRAAHAVERGQQLLLADLAELVESASAAAGHPESCECARIADRVLAELTVQADVERRHLFAVLDR